jgi:hypothetical protein
MTGRLLARAILRIPALLLVLPLLGEAGAPAAPQEVEMPAPDFSEVTTQAAARKLAREGKLIRILYFPAEFGGPDEPQNVGYITPEAAEVRDMVISQFDRLVDEDLIDKLNVVPDYKGDSVIPSSITMTASHSGREGAIATTIEVW